MFRKKELPGKSVWKKVSKDDEWCSEAYLETDYSTLSEEDFIRNMKEYVLFKLSESNNYEVI